MDRRKLKDFYKFNDYLQQETDNLFNELNDAFQAGEMDCPHCFSLEFTSYYKTQYLQEIWSLTKNNPAAAFAVLYRRGLQLSAEQVLLESMMTNLDELHSQDEAQIEEQLEWER